ncbi:MAG: potassium/proton antiporter [Burkholderiaceae bacterium]|nr:potassium/proton antiporter [Burkholderiaceae bacterium]
MESTLELLGLSTLIGATLVVLSILLGLITSRAGMPLLLVFLAVGMLAGEDGPGGIQFDNHQLSFWIANIALAVILLDGGLRTPMAIFRVALKPAMWLATVGVFLTCALLAILAIILFDLPFTLALLFGAIVSSTDAAAVFSLLKNLGLKLNERVEATLEIESGINDPMAIFLTLLAISLLSNGVMDLHEIDWFGILGMLVQQAGIGLLLAYIWGRAFAKIVQHLKIENHRNHGINALLVLSAGIAIFGLATVLGGSGFLAIYVFGLILGNQKTRLVKTIVPAMDGLAWLFQASMFLLLGLLATPSAVLQSLGPGLGLALLLMFVVRPLAVIPCLVPFRYTPKEMLFVSWVGLRGAVPIILAIFPVIAGVDHPRLMLDLALLVVILSLLMQGSTIGWVARKLDLVLPEASDVRGQRQIFGSFTLDGRAPMAEVVAFYGLDAEVDDAAELTLDEWLKQQLGKPPVVGDVYSVPNVSFVVKEMSGANISKVGFAQ